MQVKFTRTTGTTKGLLSGGKHVFRLSIILNATPAEAALISKYGRWSRTILLDIDFVGSEGRNAFFSLAYDKLRTGAQIEHENMNVIFTAERRIVEDCQNSGHI